MPVHLLCRLDMHRGAIGSDNDVYSRLKKILSSYYPSWDPAG